MNCEVCTGYIPASEYLYSPEDNKEWTKIKKRVGLRKGGNHADAR